MVAFVLSLSGQEPLRAPSAKRRTVVEEIEIPASLRDNYYSIKKGFVQYSARWRNGWIEYCNVVEVLPNTVSWHFHEKIMIASPYYAVSGLETVSISSTRGFFQVAYRDHVDASCFSGETALEVGLSLPGATLNASRSLQPSFVYQNLESFTTSYSDEQSFVAAYRLRDMPYIPRNGHISGCLVGDYFEATARIKEEEYWFWGTYETLGWQGFKFRQYTFVYNTYQFTDGSFGSSIDRNYA